MQFQGIPYEYLNMNMLFCSAYSDYQLALVTPGNFPSLAMLLAGPALSLPSMIVINQIMGIKRGMTYIFLVVLIATVSGYTFGIMIA